MNRQEWIAQKQQAHRDRVARRKQREAGTFTMGIDDTLALLRANGIDIPSQQLYPYLESGVPYIDTPDGPKLDEAEFIRHARATYEDSLRIEAAVASAERAEQDEDRAWALLEGVGDIDYLIRGKLVYEDENNVCTITAGGWAMVKSLGWEATPS